MSYTASSRPRVRSGSFTTVRSTRRKMNVRQPEMPVTIRRVEPSGAVSQVGVALGASQVPTDRPKIAGGIRVKWILCAVDGCRLEGFHYEAGTHKTAHGA